MITLFHYFEKQNGPFQNLSDLSISEAQKVLNSLKSQNDIFASKRDDQYLQRRAELEQMVRKIFISKGGKPIRNVPHYMVVEACPWLETWYRESDFVKIPIAEFDVNTISFTYGDMFPTFSPRVCDGKEYRNKVYRYDEILELIKKYGLPQNWTKDGQYGPERYIEAQIWSDHPIQQYLTV